MSLSREQLSEICVIHGLTAKQTEFVVAYIGNGRNAAAAYRTAFNARPNSSAHTACVEGSRLLQHTKVAAALRDIYTKVMPAVTARAIEKTAIDKTWIMKKLALVSQRCLQEAPVLDRDGAPVLVATPSGVLAAAYEFDAAGSTKALYLLGRELGMFDRKPGDVEVVPPEVEERRRQARARVQTILKLYEQGMSQQLLPIFFEEFTREQLESLARLSPEQLKMLAKLSPKQLAEVVELLMRGDRDGKARAVAITQEQSTPPEPEDWEGRSPPRRSVYGR